MLGGRFQRARSQGENAIVNAQNAGTGLAFTFSAFPVFTFPIPPFTFPRFQRSPSRAARTDLRERV